MHANTLTHKDELISLNCKPIVVVCAADDKYSMPLAVVARSALENLKRDRKMHLFVIDGGITDSNKHKIMRSLDLNRCQVEFLPQPDDWIETIREALNYLKEKTSAEKKHVVAASAATYYRLFISELLPDSIDRAIYLDCDLVVKGNLEQLWEADFRDNYVLAVQDMWTPSAAVALPDYQHLGVSADSKYFNAGVLALNLKKWRADKITARAIEYLKRHKEHIHEHDQGLLNALLAGQWGELDRRWNLTPAILDLYSSWQESPFSEDAYNRLIQEPYIIHFATSRKPWNSRHTPFKESFFNYVDQTAWSGWRLTFWKQLQLRLNREFRKILG